MSIKITAKLIEAICSKSHPEVATSQWIAQEVERLNGIKSTIRCLEDHKEDAREEYEKVVQDRDRRIAEIQAKCDHLDMTYHSDASGNNDSDTQCNICGKWGV